MIYCSLGLAGRYGTAPHSVRIDFVDCTRRADDCTPYRTGHRSAHWTDLSRGEPVATTSARANRLFPARSDLRQRRFASGRCAAATYPELDDNTMGPWAHGLMICTFARAAQVLDDPRYFEIAARSAKFDCRASVSDASAFHRNALQPDMDSLSSCCFSFSIVRSSRSTIFWPRVSHAMCQIPSAGPIAGWCDGTNRTGGSSQRFCK